MWNIFFIYTDDDRRKMIRGIGGLGIKSEATSRVQTAELTHSQTAQGNCNYVEGKKCKKVEDWPV